MIRTERKIKPDDCLEDTGARVAHLQADSWADFVDYAEASKPVAGGRVSRVSGRGKSWTPDEWPESLALARSGWYGAEAKIRALAAEIYSQNGTLSHTVAFTMACAGEEYDIGALSEGRPECMYLPTSEITKGRTIRRIAVPVGANCNIGSDAFLMQGAMVCALVQAIEDSGQTCEINAIIRCHDEACMRIDVPLMSAGDSIDLPFLAFALAHASTTRRLAFSAMECDPLAVGLQAVERGHYARWAEDQGVLALDASYGDVRLPSVEWVARWSVSEAADWVRKAIEGLA